MSLTDRYNNAYNFLITSIFYTVMAVTLRGGDGSEVQSAASIRDLRANVMEAIEPHKLLAQVYPHQLTPYWSHAGYILIG
jgi:hypothetical protein